MTVVSRTTNPLCGSMPVARDDTCEASEVPSVTAPSAAQLSATTVSREYSPSTRASPPAMTVPSSATDQSPDLLPLMAVCTSLPSRGPAARALTTSFC